MDTDTSMRILVEVANGQRPAVEDTPEMAAKRAVYRSEVDAIRRKGGIVEIPSELG